MCLNIKIWKYLCSNYTNMSNFQPHEVVGHASETQLQVAENSNKLTNIGTIVGLASATLDQL